MRLGPPGAPRAAIVFHPGRVRLDRLRASVEAAQREHGWAASTWHPTARADSGREAARAAAREDPDVVLVAAGDGTVRLVAEEFLHSRTHLAVLPVGTGNLLARNLRLPTGADRSIAVAFGGVPHWIDVGHLEVETEAGDRNAYVFLVMAGLGLDAEMAERTDAGAKARFGWMAYVRPIARSVLANRQFRLHYRIDGGLVHSARAHTVIVGNCGTLTGNMLLLPDAQVDDGLLDVVMFRPKGGFGWTRIGTRLTVQGLFRRTRLNWLLRQLMPDLKALVYAQGRRFEVDFDVPHAVELDGDGIGRIVRARLTVEQQALAVRRPAERGREVPPSRRRGSRDLRAAALRAGGALPQQAEEERADEEHDPDDREPHQPLEGEAHDGQHRPHDEQNDEYDPHTFRLDTPATPG